MRKRRPLEGDGYWSKADPLGQLADYDPIRETTAQARAQARGERFVSFEERQRALPPRPDPVPLTPPSVTEAPPDLPLDMLRRANADPDLFASGLKILLVILTRSDDAPISLSKFGDQTGLSKGGVIAGIRNALDGGYITREQSCPRCNATLPFTEDQKTTHCPACARSVAPQARYTLAIQETPVQQQDDPVYSLHSPVHSVDRAVQTMDSPVHLPSSPERSLYRPVQSVDSPPVHSVDRGAVQSVDSAVQPVDSLKSRVAALIEKTGRSPVQSVDSPVHSPDRAVQSVNSSRVGADSESESNVTNDSVYIHNGKREWIGAKRFGEERDGATRAGQLQSPRERDQQLRNAHQGMGACTPA